MKKPKLDFNKIIFLDIDGVLNVISQGKDEYGSKFHKHFEDNLKTLIEKTGAKIVITSTWRSSGLNVMKNMWKDRKLPGEVIDIKVLEYLGFIGRRENNPAHTSACPGI